MPLATTPINPRALEKALEVIGGEKLKLIVIAAYQALDAFETKGYATGAADAYTNGVNDALKSVYAAKEKEEDDADLMTAAAALCSTVSQPYQGDSGDETTAA